MREVRMRIGALLVMAGAVLAVSLAAASPARAQGQIQLPPGLDPENAVLIELVTGPVIIEMFPEVAPAHVERIKTLARSGFYDGVIFHRVIDGFMAQTGDPTGTGRGGSPLPDLKAEFNDKTHKRGVVSMARASEPDSANSQFFIMFADAPHLDGQYTAWGEVVVGMELVDRVARGQPPLTPDRVMRMMVLSDVFEAMGIDPGRPPPPPANVSIPDIPADLDIDMPVLKNP